MMRFSEKAVFSAAIFLFTAVLLYQTVGMRSDAALVPRIMGFLLLALSGMQVLIDLFPAVERRLSFLNRKLAAEQSAGELEQEDNQALWGKYVFFGWIAGFVLLIYWIGMLWAAVASLFIYLRLLKRESWALSVSYSFGAALFIYLVFVVGFKLHYFL